MENKRALAIKSERLGSYNNLGVVYQALRQFEGAIEAFERALQLSPNEEPIHFNLANVEKFTPDDRRLPDPRRIIDKVDAPDEEKLAADFAMGKSLDDLREFDDAFVHLTKANTPKRRTFDYDEPQRLAMFDNVREKVFG